MKTLHAIVSQFAKDETRVEISRRDLAKIRSELRRNPPTRQTPLTKMMHHPRTHERKMYWPTRDTTFVLETERTVKDERHDEHPMIAARRRQYPKTR